MNSLNDEKTSVTQSFPEKKPMAVRFPRVIVNCPNFEFLHKDISAAGSPVIEDTSECADYHQHINKGGTTDNITRSLSRDASFLIP